MQVWKAPKPRIRLHCTRSLRRVPILDGLGQFKASRMAWITDVGAYCKHNGQEYGLSVTVGEDGEAKAHLGYEALLNELCPVLVKEGVVRP